ncbi:MAG: hypothetical protein K2L08_04405 [Erysipelotrichaceae bacterium]|nr:hypothetical protein [Erysipelotrichaceae bacterium]
MDREELLEELSESLLCEVVCLHIEKVDQIFSMLKDIHYIEDKEHVLLQVKECELLHTEDFDIVNSIIDDGNILIAFEMPFILSVWGEEDQLLRITANAVGKCKVPDIDKHNWNSIELEDMDKEALLANQNLVDIVELGYTYVECDDVRCI